MRKVLISADSTCDLTDRQKEENHILSCPLHIILNDKSYDDSVDIFPEELYASFKSTGQLPKTAAVNTEEYIQKFQPYIDDGFDIVHINISSAISASYQNCCEAAESIGHIYPIDSKNLSTGTGLLVLEAVQLVQEGCTAKECETKLNELVPHVHASFILDRLDFMRAGGRCSTVAMLGANLLNLKPCIEVNPINGKMSVGKKYRGSLEKVLPQYVSDKINAYPNIRNGRIFITHSGISAEREQLVYNHLKETGRFSEIIITRASCTISSHCGPNTLGVLFMD
ncbi:MAG: DegV family protein [Acutalibacteraceae bacterium]